MTNKILDKLFNNKWLSKEIKKLQEISETKAEPEFIIQKRIRTLYVRMKELRKDYNNPAFELVTDEYQGEPTLAEVFTFDTTYGKRKVLVQENLIAYGTENLYRQFMNCGDTYTDLHGAFFIIEIVSKLFEKGKEVLVKKPVPNDMTPEQIDLAILEVEQIIDKLYKEFIIQKHKEKEYKEYFSTVFYHE